MAGTEALYKRADEAFLKKNYDYARDLFMQILSLEPNNAKARQSLYATITKKFQEQGAPGKLKLKMLQAKNWAQLKATKDPDKKIDLAQNHLNEDPTNHGIRTALAEGLLVKGYSEGAAAECEIIFKSDPKNVPGGKVLVQAYKNLKKVQQAQRVLDMLASGGSEDRDIDRLRRDLAAMQTMKAGFEDAKSYRDVLKNADQAEELEKKQHLITNEEQLVAVLQSLEKQFAANPKDDKIPKKIADLIAEKRKDYKAAKEWYAKAVEANPQNSVNQDKVDDCEIRIQEAALAAAKQAGDRARYMELKKENLLFKIKSYERRVKDRPTDMALRFELGVAYFSAGASGLDKAVAQFQQSMKDPKRKSNSHFYLGRAFQVKKMFDLADKQYDAAMNGVLAQASRHNITYFRAVCAAEAGNFAQAVSLGKVIMEEDISYKDIAQRVSEWEKQASQKA